MSAVNGAETLDKVASPRLPVLGNC